MAIDPSVLHESVLVIDAHADTPSKSFGQAGYDFGARNQLDHLDLPRLREGGIDLQFLIAWVPAEFSGQPGASFGCARDLCLSIESTIAATPGAQLITRMAELAQVRSAGDVAFMIGVEGGHAIENSLERLRDLHDLGARYLTLTWNNTNDWADSSSDLPRHGGLTEFGRSVIREMNRLGMVVDLSHAASTTFYQALDLSTAPVIASHSCAAALTPNDRNLDDDQLRALAAAGGVVGVNYFPRFLDTTHGEALTRLDAEAESLRTRLEGEGEAPVSAAEASRRWRDSRLHTLPPVTAELVADHIDHMVEVAGIDHVGLGSDFDGIPTVPTDLPDCAALPHLTALLAGRGYDEDSIAKILGGNLFRVLEAVVG